MFKVAKKIFFCAGHRLMNHPGRCRNVHGHNYEVDIEISSNKLLQREQGFVVDFSELNPIKVWIDAAWDHGFLVQRNDVSLVKMLEDLDSKMYVMDDPPSAENMARVLVEIVAAHITNSWDHSQLIDEIKVSVKETPKCVASYVSTARIGTLFENIHE